MAEIVKVLSNITTLIVWLVLIIVWFCKKKNKKGDKNMLTDKDKEIIKEMIKNVIDSKENKENVVGNLNYEIVVNRCVDDLSSCFGHLPIAEYVQKVLSIYDTYGKDFMDTVKSRIAENSNGSFLIKLYITVIVELYVSKLLVYPDALLESRQNND